MGSKYSVQVWGRWLPGEDYSYTMVWQGQSFLQALWELVKARRLGFGCTKLECR
jgi:hypothetical protein